MDDYNTKLLPCPCCNSRVKYLKSFKEIYCFNCKLKIKDTSISEMELFKRWNTRKPVDIVLEKIKKEEICSQKGLDNAIANSIKNTKYGEVRGYNTSYNILDLCTKELEFINSDLYETFIKEMEE